MIWDVYEMGLTLDMADEHDRHNSSFVLALPRVPRADERAQKQLPYNAHRPHRRRRRRSPAHCHCNRKCGLKDRILKNLNEIYEKVYNFRGF